MIITTAFDVAEDLVLKAKNLALELGMAYYPRKKKSIKFLSEHVSSQIFVVNNHRGLSYYEQGEEVFFHPNMAILRIKQLSDGQKDSLVTACKLEAGMTLLDGTLGLASDSLVASFVVGNRGHVVSIEKSFPLYVVVKEGLNYYGSQNPLWEPLIGRLNIKNADNLDYLRSCASHSYDIVYFDFMFNRPVEGSTGIQVISSLAMRDVLTEEHVVEALRVAKQRVVVKSSYGNDILESLGFKIEKANRKRHFCYAVIEKLG